MCVKSRSLSEYAQNSWHQSLLIEVKIMEAATTTQTGLSERLDAIEARIRALAEELEDLEDTVEALRAIEDVKLHGSEPWEKIKQELGV